MQVRDGMSRDVLTIGPDHTLRDAAGAMARRRVGAAIVLDSDGHGPGILTERDVLDAVAAGQDAATERVDAHVTRDVVVAAPEWSLEQAASTMLRHGFRHLVVVENGEVVGVLSMRDIVRCWSETHV